MSATYTVPPSVPGFFLKLGKHPDAFYGPQAARDLVTHLRRQPKIYMSGDGHRLEQVAGLAVRESIRFDPDLHAVIGEVLLSPRLRRQAQHSRWTGDDIEIVLVGQPQVRGGTVVGWSRFAGCELLPRSGACGLPVQEADRLDDEGEEEMFARAVIETMSADELAYEVPGLYEQVRRQVQAEQQRAAVRAALREAAEQVRETGSAVEDFIVCGATGSYVDPMAEYEVKEACERQQAEVRRFQAAEAVTEVEGLVAGMFKPMPFTGPKNLKRYERR